MGFPDLCAPALIYVAFSITQIIIDTLKGFYNTAFFKFIVMIIITILLDTLCQKGMGIASWIIVFIPFIFMSVIVGILLYVFGLDPATGTLKIKCDDCDEKKTTNKGGNLIYSKTTVTGPRGGKVKYTDVSYSDTPTEHDDNYSSYPSGTSDPEYT